MAPTSLPRPRPEPEVLAAQTRAMLAPFFRGDLGAAPVLADPISTKPAPCAALSREMA